MFIWPLDDHIITRDFYYKANLYVGGQHAALDLIRRTGTTRAAPIRVIENGVVVGVGWDMYSGFFVAVDHAGGFRSFYRHLYGQTPVVVGQQVTQGQIIGNVGNTGWSQGDHLHFDLWNRDKIRDDAAIFYKNNWYAIDPALYLGQEGDMTFTPAEEAEIRAVVHDFHNIVNSIVQGRFDMAFSQISWLRVELGLPPEFDTSQAHESNLRKILDWLRAHANDANYHQTIHEIKAGLEALGGGVSGISEDRAREIAQEEDDRQRITKG